MNENSQIEDESHNMGSGSLIAGPVLKVLVPRGIDYLWNKIVGKRILICGLGRSGKSSFQKYLMRGIIVKERETEKTRDHEKISDTKIHLGSSSSFTLRLKTSVDSPGQLGTIEQASSVARYNPHYLFVFLDCSRIEESKNWFTDFCENLDSQFKYYPYLASNVRSIFIVLNKYDKLTGDATESVDEKYQKFRKKIKDIAEDYLKYSFFRSLRKVRIPYIFQTICVKTEHGTEFVDELINNLASNI